MKITLCGSIAFIDELHALKAQLEESGHEVKLPPLEQNDNNGNPIPAKELYVLRQSLPPLNHWIWDVKEKAMHAHFDKVLWSDVILVLNPPKNNIPHYIGANTLLEMGLAFHYKKPIYIFYSIPEISCKEEILGMKPIVLNGNLEMLALNHSVIPDSSKDPNVTNKSGFPL